MTRNRTQQIRVPLAFFDIIEHQLGLTIPISNSVMKWELPSSTLSALNRDRPVSYEKFLHVIEQTMKYCQPSHPKIAVHLKHMLILCKHGEFNV